MADSTVTDFSKMKVVELRKELKSRGLSHSGDKSELLARLQAAVNRERAYITLDSDEIDSDGVLEDEDDKSQSEIILDEAAVNDSLSEELALADPSPTKESPVNVKPQRTLKRKLTNTLGAAEVNKEQPKDTKNSENKEIKKIVLNRTTSITSPPRDSKLSPQSDTESDKINPDTKSRLEIRAKRFGLPVTMTESERKEARKIRFGQSSLTTGVSSTPSLTDNYEKLKKRAERFGQSVSKIMTDLENRERLEKRKEKFSSAN